MPKVINLYIDESGTRHPDHNPKPQDKPDYFAFGGILIKDEEEIIARELYKDFCEKWSISYPLHSVEIRGKHENFKWIGELNKEQQKIFIEELYQLLYKAPIFGIACVIDRPGYNNRYKERYGLQRWRLCKTAFNILVERAAKYADSQDYRLRILPEKCNKQEDQLLKEYYEILKQNGLPFNESTSSQYAPLKSQEFQKILYEFKLKEKSSPLVQLADLYLWPMAMGGYDTQNRTYKRLLENKKLIDCFISEENIPQQGIKYSCFEFIRDLSSSSQNT